MHLFDANRQWANRGPDERFESLGDMYRACFQYAERAVEASVPRSSVKVNFKDDEVILDGTKGVGARMSHWAFGQVARLAGAPASYLRLLPADLASQCLAQGLGSDSDVGMQLLFHKPAGSKSAGDLLLRALTSESYTRVWNHQIADQLRALLDEGWRVPPARPAVPNQPGARKATPEDILPGTKSRLSVSVGDLIAPAGLYASDHDMFVFLVNEKERLDDGTSDGCSRGVFIENSEVGDRAAKVTSFLYRHVCGNHIVWDAEKLVRQKVRHVGDANSRVRMLIMGIRASTGNSPAEDNAKIKVARSRKIAADRDAVLKKVFPKVSWRITFKQLEEAFDLAAEYSDEDGDPRTPWGLAQGISRLSQGSPFTDERTKLDRAAGTLLNLRFS